MANSQKVQPTDRNGVQPGSTEAGIVKLAPELLTDILLSVRIAVGRKTFAQCLLVCRRWYQLGRPLLWSSIVLTNGSLEPFVNRFEAHSAVCTHIRCLSLQLTTIWPLHRDGRPWDWPDGVNPRTAAQWAHLDRLAMVLRNHMSNLTTFSLVIEKTSNAERTLDHANTPDGAWMSGQVLKTLMEALPASCTNLEIDTRGREDEELCGYHKLTRVHLCPTIQQLLPQLVHLRLRLANLCPILLKPNTNVMPDKWIVAPRLHSCVINLNLEPNSVPTRVCSCTKSSIHVLPGNDSWVNGRWDFEFPDARIAEVDPPPTGEAGDPAADDKNASTTDKSVNAPLTAKRRASICETERRQKDDEQLDLEDEAYSQISLGRTLRDLFVAQKLPQVQLLRTFNLESESGGHYHHSRVQDIITNETHWLPFRPVSLLNQRFGVFSFVARNLADDEAFGQMGHLERWVEASAWKSTIEGVRVVESGVSMCARDVALQNLPLETRAQFLQRETLNSDPRAAKNWADAQNAHSSKKRGL